jgi:3-isopropylmalate/(R)-2-methylmalate dehydratase small subunit
MSGRIQGHAVLLGERVSIDVLHPSRFFSLDPERLAAGLLAGRKQPLPPDPIIVGGPLLGLGSSRESVIRALAAHGVRALLAESFSRIFFRNCINAGIPALPAPGIHQRIRDGELLEIELARGRLLRVEAGEALALPRLDPFHEQVLAAGGLLRWLEERG